MRVVDRDALIRRRRANPNLMLVAVLSPRNYRLGRIPGSRNFQSVDAAKAQLALDDEIILYCAGSPCLNSAWAYRLLEEHGYTDVSVYEGGLIDWSRAGCELESACHELDHPVQQDSQNQEVDRDD